MPAAGEPTQKTSSALTENRSKETKNDEPEMEMKDVKKKDGFAHEEIDFVEEEVMKGIYYILSKVEFLYEAVVEGAVTKIVASFAWANSTSLDDTILLTFDDIIDTDSSDVVWVSWLYFIFICLLLIAFAYKFRKCLNYVSHKEKKLLAVKNEDRTPVLVIEKYFNDFEKAFSKLFLDTFSIVCSLALIAAATTTSAEIAQVEYDDDAGYFEDDDGMRLDITLIYAFLITAIVCLLSWRMFTKDKHKNLVDASKDLTTKKSAKPLKDAAKTISGLIIAYAWRGVFIVFIISLVGPEKSDETGYWVYCLIVTLVATTYLSFLDLYTCCTPNFGSLPFQKNSSAREYLTGVLISALQYSVGLAYVDAFVTTFKTENTEDQMAANWAYCGIMMCFMVLSATYLKKCILSISAEVSGILQFIDDNMDAIDFYHDWEREGSARRPFPEYFRDNFIDISLHAISLAAGFSISPAINATIVYVLEQDASSHTVLGSWIAVICLFIITSLISLYLGRLLKRVRTARKNAMELVEDTVVKEVF